MTRIQLITLFLFSFIGVFSQTHTSDVDITGDITIGKTGDSGNLKIRRGSDGNTVGIIGFLGGGTEANNLSFSSSSGGGYFSFRTNYGGGLSERFRIANNGNVGIGTLNPSSKLSIRKTGSLDGVKLLDFSEVDDEEFIFKGYFEGVGATGNKVSFGSNIAGWQSNIMSWQADGKVGIGIITPESKLSISGSNSEGWNSGIELNREDGGQGRIVVDAQGMKFRTTKDGDGFYFRDNSNATSMFIKDGGQVGIGTTNPDTKLTVKGTIHSEEVKVDLNVPAPDYVFEPDYKLRTLKETKEYIAENKHLPEIPSAAEIGKNGIDLGDMDMRLLKKIEELTLYQIALLERIEQLESKNAEIDELKKKIQTLSTSN